MLFSQTDYFLLFPFLMHQHGFELEFFLLLSFILFFFSLFGGLLQKLPDHISVLLLQTRNICLNLFDRFHYLTCRRPLLSTLVLHSLNLLVEFVSFVPGLQKHSLQQFLACQLIWCSNLVHNLPYVIGELVLRVVSDSGFDGSGVVLVQVLVDHGLQLVLNSARKHRFEVRCGLIIIFEFNELSKFIPGEIPWLYHDLPELLLLLFLLLLGLLPLLPLLLPLDRLFLFSLLLFLHSFLSFLFLSNPPLILQFLPVSPVLLPNLLHLAPQPLIQILLKLSRLGLIFLVIHTEVLHRVVQGHQSLFVRIV